MTEAENDALVAEIHRDKKVLPRNFAVFCAIASAAILTVSVVAARPLPHKGAVRPAGRQQSASLCPPCPAPRP